MGVWGVGKENQKNKSRKSNQLEKGEDEESSKIGEI